MGFTILLGVCLVIATVSWIKAMADRDEMERKYRELRNTTEKKFGYAIGVYKHTAPEFDVEFTKISKHK